MLILNSIWSVGLLVAGFIGSIYLYNNAREVFDWFNDKFTNSKI